jgi:hypothetical protein
MLRQFDTQVLTRIIDYLGDLNPAECNFYHENLGLKHFDKNLLFRNLFLDANEFSSIGELQNLPNALSYLEIRFIMFDSCKESQLKMTNLNAILRWIPSTIKFLNLHNFELHIQDGMQKFVNENTHPNLISAIYLDAHAPFYSPKMVTVYNNHCFNIQCPQDQLKTIFGLNNRSKDVALSANFFIIDKKNSQNILELHECYPVAETIKFTYWYYSLKDICLELPSTLRDLIFNVGYEYGEECLGLLLPTLKISSPSIQKIDARSAIFQFDPNVIPNELIVVKIDSWRANIPLPDSVTSLEIDSIDEIENLPTGLVDLRFKYGCRKKDKNKSFYHRVEWVDKLPATLRKLRVNCINTFGQLQDWEVVGSPLDTKELLYLYSKLPRSSTKLDFDNYYGYNHEMILSIKQAKFLPELKILIMRDSRKSVSKTLLKVLPKSITHLELNKISGENADFARIILPNLTKFKHTTSAIVFPTIADKFLKIYEHSMHIRNKSHLCEYNSVPLAEFSFFLR